MCETVSSLLPTPSPLSDDQVHQSEPRTVAQGELCGTLTESCQLRSLRSHPKRAAFTVLTGGEVSTCIPWRVAVALPFSCCCYGGAAVAAVTLVQWGTGVPGSQDGEGGWQWALFSLMLLLCGGRSGGGGSAGAVGHRGTWR
jgi:hypothetical protein